MALADSALELLYVMAVLTHIGFDFTEIEIDMSDSHAEAHEMYHDAATKMSAALSEMPMGIISHDGPVEVFTDNSGAKDLCLRSTVGANSRHVERKVFKMRELHHEGKVRVGLVPTAENAADIFTKPLPNKIFAKHRATIYNFAAQHELTRAGGQESTTPA